MTTPSGQASVSWRARPGVVLRGTLAHGFVVAVVPGIPLIAAVLEREIALSAALAAATVICLFAGLAGRHWAPPKDMRTNEATCTLALLFIIASLLPVPAFMAIGLPAVDSVFEAVSGITSTGLTVARDTMEWPVSAHILRSWLQWSGGFAIAVAGAALILGSGSAASAMGSVGIDDRDLLSSTRAQARNLLWAYVAITAAAVLVLMLLLPTWWEGLSVALTAVSTGGFTPRADSLASYSRPAQAIVIGFCVLTSVSLVAYVFLGRGEWRKALSHGRFTAFLTLCGGGSLLVTLFVAFGAEGASADIADSVLNFLSGITTAGFSVAPLSPAPFLLALVLTAMVVGGGVGSTAGGLKFDRLLTMLSMVQLALLRLRTPSRAVTRLIQQGERVPTDRILGFAAVTFCYVVSALVVWSLFLLSGAPPLQSLFDVVSALSTVGLSTGITSPDMDAGLKIALAAAMLLGRLEFLALLLLLSPRTWIERS